MNWTIELVDYLDKAPFPATKKDLIDYAERTCAPLQLIENLESLDDEDIYENIEEICPDPPRLADYFYSDEDDNY